MTPVVISGCFGWLHVPPEERRTRRGVVLCPAIGNEACNVYRSWVVLAEMLAQAGVTVLRFDYPGTGDSASGDDVPVGPDDFTRGIAACASWLRVHAKVDEVALCGLRAGAAFATLATSRMSGLWGLALLAPVVSGRSLIREMVIGARAWDAMWMVEAPTEADGWFEANGLRLASPAKEAVEAIDLRRLETRPAPRALLVESSQTPASRAFVARLAELGTEVTQTGFPGYEGLMQDALDAVCPREAFAQVVTWLTAGAEPAVLPPLARDRCIVLDVEGALETAVRFGPDDSLAGILCMPADGKPVRLAALILNTGAHPHTGHSRLAVTFARRLARRGIATLRMDASGIGDSALSTGESTHVYSQRNLEDARTGLRWLHEHAGVGVLLIGLCSGAFVAAQISQEPALRGLVLVNLQRFVWQEGTPLKVVQTTTKRTTEFYMTNIRSLGVWSRLLRGQIDVRGISRALAGRAARRIRSAADPLLGKVGLQSRYGLVRGWFEELARRRVPVLYALSFNDPGLDELEEYFGAGGVRLNRMGNVRLHRLENADHTLTHHATREELYQLVAALADRLAPDGLPVPEPIQRKPAMKKAREAA